MSAAGVTCPDCGGKKEVDAFVNRGAKGCTWETVDCPRCRGVGTISAEHAKRIEDGKAMRSARVARMESQMEAAKRLGMTPREYSMLESGS